jgi:hypothetical protein
MKNIAALSGLLGSEWLEHPRHHGYFFSADGRAASWHHKKPRLLTGCECGIGYRAISVPVDGQYIRVYIHRAVCELFNGGGGSGLQCRHLDTNLKHNAASNLAWGTALDNASDAKRAGKTGVGIKNPQAKLSPGAVAQMKELRTLGVFYRNIAAHFGVTTMTAHRAINGVSWI